MNIQQRTAKTVSLPGRAPFRISPECLAMNGGAREERLAVTYEHVGVGIVEVDQAGRMLRVNQKVCELMGHEAADLLGRSIFDETLPQDVAQDLRPVQATGRRRNRSLHHRKASRPQGRLILLGGGDVLERARCGGKFPVRGARSA